jgi:hypothetical protein
MRARSSIANLANLAPYQGGYCADASCPTMLLAWDARLSLLLLRALPQNRPSWEQGENQRATDPRPRRLVHRAPRWIREHSELGSSPRRQPEPEPHLRRDRCEVQIRVAGTPALPSAHTVSVDDRNDLRHSGELPRLASPASGQPALVAAAASCRGSPASLASRHSGRAAAGCWQGGRVGRAHGHKPHRLVRTQLPRQPAISRTSGGARYCATSSS